MTLLKMLEDVINRLEQQNMILQQQLEQAKKAIEELKSSNNKNKK